MRHIPKMPANIETAITIVLSFLDFCEISDSSVKIIIKLHITNISNNEIG